MRTYTFTCMHKHTLVNHECNASILSCRCHSRCCLLLKAFVYVYKRTNTCTYTSTHAQTDLHAHNLQVRTHTIHATTQANMRVHYTCNYTQANMQLHTKQATTRYTSNYTQPTCNCAQPTTCNYTLYKQLHTIQATTHSQQHATTHQPTCNCLCRVFLVTMKQYLACQAVVLPQVAIGVKVVLVTPAVNQIMIHKCVVVYRRLRWRACVSE